MTRHWFAIRLPESTAYVPARSIEAARMALARTSYKGAPVNSWPLVETYVGTRGELALYLATAGRVAW